MNRNRKVLTGVAIVAGVGTLLCVVCIGIGLIGSSSPTYKATATARAVAAVTEAARPTRTTAPSATPEPTNTPRPTDTPQPSKTPVPPTQTPVPPTETPVPLGTSRSNPAPIGQPVVADDKMEITVLGVRRGGDAWAAISGYNMFNSEPDEGMEYVLARVRARYLGAADQTRQLSELYFRAVGDKGAIYDTELFMVVGKDLASELFGGGVTEGELVFEVGKGEGQVVLIYDSGAGTRAYYCALEQ